MRRNSAPHRLRTFRWAIHFKLRLRAFLCGPHMLNLVSVWAIHLQPSFFNNCIYGKWGDGVRELGQQGPGTDHRGPGTRAAGSGDGVREPGRRGPGRGPGTRAAGSRDGVWELGRRVPGTQYPYKSVQLKPTTLTRQHNQKPLP
jgi:hypothetical protein